MGIGIVLLLYAVAMTIAATVAAALLGCVTYFLTAKSAAGRKRAMIASISFPFLCVGYAGGWFVAYAVINAAVFDRDPGLGDSWQTPLPNGYALTMIDTTDQGTVYNPKTQRSSSGIGSQDDAVFGVRQLQVFNSFVFGARDSKYFGHLGQESNAVDSFFELDTANNKHTDFTTLDQLKQRAAYRGVTLHLRGFSSVFSDYRTTWFDYTAGLILLLIPAIGCAALARIVYRARQTAAPMENAPPARNA